MPLLEWCTTSFSSLQNSVHTTVNNYLNNLNKPGLEVPLKFLEIRELNGQKPGDKYRSFNTIINVIVENVKNGADLQNQLEIISLRSMSNLVRVNVAVKLQLRNDIVESLKSDDRSIVRKALTARRFFDGGNPHVSAEYFAADILPFVSVRTRLDIVKRLAHGLRGHEDKAREFFVKFVELYDIQQILPILIMCSESYIFDAILRYKIVLSPKALKVLYSKYRDLVVYYLQLGNDKNADNAADRKMHEITINNYDVFLPTLIRHYPQDFIVLYELTPEKNLGILSVNRSILLLKNVKNLMISKANIFLKMLQPKIVKKMLTTDEIDSMLEHYLPADVNDFILDVALDFLENYLGNKKIQVLISKFEKLYDKDLLEYARKLIALDSKHASSVLRLLRKLPEEFRENQIRILMGKTEEGSIMKKIYTSYLKPSDSFAQFKEIISKSSSSDERMQLIGLMITSCAVQNSKKDLLVVLQYYREKHKNEQNVYALFEHLKKEFDLQALDDAHWSVLRDIINTAYVKKQLFTSHLTLIESVLEETLRHALKRRNDGYADKVIEMIVECKMENFSPSWNVLEENPVLERECLEKFFFLIQVRYPEYHSIWKQKNDRLVIALSLLKTLRNYNARCVVKNANKKKDTNKKLTAQPINLRDYPWIGKLTEEFFSRMHTGYRKELLVKLIKQQDPDFYETKMNEHLVTRDIGNGDALRLLKRQPEKVAANWMAYLNEAREKIQDTKRASYDKSRESLRARSFIAATKWHHDLPIKFIEMCIEQQKNEGSLAILGILLPGEAFEKVAMEFVPKDAEIKASEKNAKENFELTRDFVRAMRFTCPPMSFDSLQPYCRGDYFCIVDGTLTSLARRVNVSNVLQFAKKLASKSQASLVKRAIRLSRIVATKQEFREILIETWNNSTDVSIRKILAKMIFQVFVTTPNADNWELMRTCLRGLTVNDRDAIEELNEIEKISAEYLSDYVEKYLAKVEELFALTLDFKWRTKSVCLLVESFDEKLMNDVSEEVSVKILEKYFFDKDCSEISRATRRFAVRYYLLPSGGKFAARLHAIVNILTKAMESFDVPQAKMRRYYPTNYSIQEFFGDLLTELSASESDKKLQIIESVIGVFNTNLSPCQEPTSYINLNLFKEYLLSTSPQDFGIRVARRISTLVEDFSSNEPIADIADCLNDFIFNKIFRNYKNPFDLKLAVIEGLIQEEFYGALTSSKLLNPDEVSEYDDRYDNFITSLRRMKNSSIQYNLYRHINNLTEQ